MIEAITAVYQAYQPFILTFIAFCVVVGVVEYVQDHRQ